MPGFCPAVGREWESQGWEPPGPLGSLWALGHQWGPVGFRGKGGWWVGSEVSPGYLGSLWALEDQWDFGLEGAAPAPTAQFPGFSPALGMTIGSGEL